jgi:hypothetical protein
LKVHEEMRQCVNFVAGFKAIQSAYDDSTKCPDGGRCSHTCGEGGPCYRVLTCSPLTSYGEDWPEDVVAEHVRRFDEADECSLCTAESVVDPDAGVESLREDLVAQIAVSAETMGALDAARQRANWFEEKCEEQEQEIARHHKDFERWEEMADKGAAQIERAKRLERAVQVLVPVAEQWIDAFSDDDRMTMFEAFRYTEVCDTVVEFAEGGRRE